MLTTLCDFEMEVTNKFESTRGFRSAARRRWQLLDDIKVFCG